MSRNINRYIARQMEFWCSQAFGIIKPSYAAYGAVCNANDLYKLLLHIEEHNEDSEAGMVEVEMAIGDVMAMCQRICSMLHLDIEDIYFNGCQRITQKGMEIVEGSTAFDNDPRYILKKQG
ncbi:MAG: hypothetical protein PHY18_06595 [Dehalococcoidales bacterium]|nr:hypothetical protein [Dehalococcoidales bacterium]